MKPLIISAAILILVILVGHSVLNRNDQQNNSYIEIGGHKIELEIADTDAARARGLSGRLKLGENEGMLFVFDQPGHYGFWMKEMNFPIDIIWIDEERQVVGIEHKVPPESFPQVFYPREAVKYVLEVNAGFAAAHGLTEGFPLSLAFLTGYN